MRAEAIRTRRWSRREYERLTDQGFFRADERLELIEGQLIFKEPQNTPHVAAVALAADALRAAFGPGWFIRQQFPIALDDWSEPEPDISVVPGSPRDYLPAHPDRPVLIVEIAESRLGFDRGTKAPIYARAGVADYWIVNLVDRVLEIYRDPQRSGRQWRYRSGERVGPDGEVSPLAAPGVRIRVADLLP
jgi:Uma2 family endonuclease